MSNKEDLTLTSENTDMLSHVDLKEESREIWLTTNDNPYDPFNQWDLWFNFDLQMNYNTPGLVARFAKVSEELSDADYNRIMEDAINRIIEMDFLNIYKKVYNNKAN